MRATIEDWSNFKGSNIQKDLIEHLQLILLDIGNEICKVGDDFKMEPQQAYRVISHLMGSRQAIEKLIAVIKDPVEIGRQLSESEEVKREG